MADSMGWKTPTLYSAHFTLVNDTCYSVSDTSDEAIVNKGDDSVMGSSILADSLILNTSVSDTLILNTSVSDTCYSVSDTSDEAIVNKGDDSGSFTVLSTLWCDCKTIVLSNVIRGDNLGTSINAQKVKRLLGPAYIRPHQKYINLHRNTTSVGTLYFLHHNRSCASSSPNSVSFSGCTASLSSESSFSLLQYFLAVFETSVFLLALTSAFVCGIIVTLFLLR